MACIITLRMVVFGADGRIRSADNKRYEPYKRPK